MTNDPAGPIRVLFLCTGNSARSQMAEAFLRHHGGGRFAVYSAGAEPAERIHPLAGEVMREAGLSLDRHYPKGLAALDELRPDWDYIITTCDRARAVCPTFPGDPERIHWGFEDPAEAAGTPEERRRVFRRVRDEVKRRVQLFAGLSAHKQRPSWPVGAQS